MNQVKKHSELSIEAIKALYASLKKDRKVLNWGEFAEQIGYDRTYTSRVINGHESLTEDFQKAIYNKFICDTEIVVNTTPNVRQNNNKQEASTALIDSLKDHNETLKQIVFNKLTETSVSLIALSEAIKANQELLQVLVAGQTAKGEMILNALDKLAGNKEGTLSLKSGKLERDFRANMKKMGSRTGADTEHKG